MSYAKEVVTEQVIEEVVEYEYEIRNGVRKCVAERNIGKTVTTQVRVRKCSREKYRKDSHYTGKSEEV